MNDVWKKYPRIKFLRIVISICICGVLISCSTSPIVAETTQYVFYYNDFTPETFFPVYDETAEYDENLGVLFNLSVAERSILCRGVRYASKSVGDGPHYVEIRFYYEMYSKEWITITDNDLTSPEDKFLWNDIQLTGSTYLLASNPFIVFASPPSSNYIMLGADTPSQGHSYDKNDVSWVKNQEFEYLVQLGYEWVYSYTPGEIKTGRITQTDLIDAYRVLLMNHNSYQFILHRVSGLGDLNMRLIIDQPLTTGTIHHTNGDFPQIMNYSPQESKTYILLVEAASTMEPTDYSIELKEYPVLTTSLDASEPPEVSSTDARLNSSSELPITDDTQGDQVGFIAGYSFEMGFFACLAILTLRKYRRI